MGRDLDPWAKVPIEAYCEIDWSTAIVQSAT